MSKELQSKPKENNSKDNKENSLIELAKKIILIGALWFVIFALFNSYKGCSTMTKTKWNAYKGLVGTCQDDAMVFSFALTVLTIYVWNNYREKS